MPTKQQAPVNKVARDYSSPSRGRGSGKKRTRRIPPSKQTLKSLRKIIDGYEWFGMFTFKMPYGFKFESERWLVSKLIKQLSDRLLVDGLADQIGFIIKREFGTKGGLHYHIGVTWKCGSALDGGIPVDTIDAFRKCFLRRIAKKKNQGRYFEWKECKGADERSRLAAYLKKEKKGRADVVSLPHGCDPSTWARLYHTRGLSPMPRNGAGAKVSPSETAPQSASDQTAPVPHAVYPNWSSLDSSSGKCCPSQNPNSSISPVSTSEADVITDEKSTRLDSFDEIDPTPKFTLFTKGNPHVLIRDQLRESTRFVELETCATCEYEESITIRRDDSTTCHVCDKEWEVCHPF